MSIRSGRPVTFLLAALVVAVPLAMKSRVASGVLTKTTEVLSITDVRFDSADPASPLAEVKEFHCPVTPVTAGSTEISLKFMAYSIGDAWPNVFQTAPVNRGIRLELAPDSTMAVLVGACPDGQPRAVSLGGVLPDTWYHVCIRLTADHHIDVTLNDQRVLAVRDLATHAEVSDIAVGAGFSRARRFHGRVEDFSFRLVRAAHTPLFWSVTLTWVAMVVMLLFRLLRLVHARCSSLLGNRSARLQFLVAFVLVGSIGAVAFHRITALLPEGGLATPGTFLFQPQDRFMDFVNIHRAFHHQATPYNSEPEGYIERAASLRPLALRGLSVLLVSPVAGPTNAYLAYAAIFVAVLGWISWKNLRQDSAAGSLRDVVVLSLMAYPVLFVLERGNDEMYVFILVYFCIHFLQGQRPGIAILFLALATLIKPFPVVFIVLFLETRTWRALVLYPLVCAVGTLGSCGAVRLLFAPKSPLIGNLHTFSDYHSLYVLGDRGLAYGSSLFGALKTLLIVSGHDHPGEVLASRYFWCATVAFGLMALHVLFVETEFWKKCALLSFAMILFPYVSSDYRLLHVYVPLYLFINKAERDPLDYLYGTLFGLLLIPKAYVALFTTSGGSHVCVSVLANPLILLCFMLVICGAGWLRRSRGEERADAVEAQGGACHAPGASPGLS